MEHNQYFNRVVELADSVVKQFDPKMKWMWGEALLGYGLTELDDFLKENRYYNFTKAYCDYYVANEPRVDQSDTSAPALITYAMQKKTGHKGYKYLTDKVLNYIKNEPRLIDDAVNHLGNSKEGRLYPKSIWVDSLMMFSVFPARYASENGDKALLDFAARQPGLYSGYMQDPVEKLWYHSYWVKHKTHYPKERIFWGRGNGWVICALPMILDYLPQDHPERGQIIKIFQETSEALLKYQRNDGYFETVLNKPEKTYRESSVTALISAGWLHGVRKGWLDCRFKEPAIKAFKAVVDNFESKKGLIYMTEISGPTIPLPVFPYAGYKYVPRGKNWSYGVAAVIFAALQYQKLVER
jgi:unsaturated rhamnogalacturonyl hydrolase